MTMTDVEIGHARPARSPDTRAAVAYLEASGATAISVIENETGCTFRIGAKIDPRAAAIFWIMEADAKPVVARARKLAGKSADATASLRQAATDLRATLTPHATAMARAGAAAERLELPAIPAPSASVRPLIHPANPIVQGTRLLRRQSATLDGKTFEQVAVRYVAHDRR